LKMKTLSKSQAGFTLVELAVVMIIIGLLIGGVLKGQEMIANARITSTIAQVKGIEAATSTFRDMYDAMPGDLTAPTTRLPGCGGGEVCGTAGSGDSIINVAPGAAIVLANENGTFWAMLAAADLVTGVSNDAQNVAWGEAAPAADAGGGFTIGHTGVGAAPGAVGTLRAGHYLAVQGTPGAAAAGTAGAAALTASQAARIDRKMDDGNADTGTVHPGDAGTCVAGSLYDEAQDLQDCELYIRIQS
jgi:prepilin-type N-terminal cleavage/methylation domain-containing protein